MSSSLNCFLKCRHLSRSVSQQRVVGSSNMISLSLPSSACFPTSTYVNIYMWKLRPESGFRDLFCFLPSNWCIRFLNLFLLLCQLNTFQWNQVGQMVLWDNTATAFNSSSLLNLSFSFFLLVTNLQLPWSCGNWQETVWMEVSRSCWWWMGSLRSGWGQSV